MNEPNVKRPTVDTFPQEVALAARRKLDALRSPDRSVWFGLGSIGLIGWSVVVPALLGTALGSWLDHHHPGRHAWTLALMFGGLSLGCLNAWRWVSQEDRAMHARDSHERP